MTALITLEKVGQRLDGKEVLREVSFKIAEGEPLALAGPSGCGKSTLLQLVAGLDAPSAGRVLLGERLASEAGRVLVPPHRRGIGMVFQDLALWPMLSVLENVAAGMPASASSRRERRAAAADMLGRCGLSGFEKRKPVQLSAGQQQRVALARALVSAPRVLLLDEPFTGLDLTARESIVDEIAELTAREQVTVVLVSHDPWEIRTLCRRIVVVEDGTIAEQGALGELLDAPANATLRAMARR